MDEIRKNLIELVRHIKEVSDEDLAEFLISCVDGLPSIYFDEEED